MILIDVQIINGSASLVAPLGTYSQEESLFLWGQGFTCFSENRQFRWVRKVPDSLSCGAIISSIYEIARRIGITTVESNWHVESKPQVTINDNCSDHASFRRISIPLVRRLYPQL